MHASNRVIAPVDFKNCKHSNRQKTGSKLAKNLTKKCIFLTILIESTNKNSSDAACSGANICPFKFQEMREKRKRKEEI